MMTVACVVFVPHGTNRVTCFTPGKFGTYHYMITLTSALINTQRVGVQDVDALDY